MSPDEPVWLLGFFTGRLHAVADPETALVFRGVPLTWSICGAPTVVNTHGARGPLCPACVAHVPGGPGNFPAPPGRGPRPIARSRRHPDHS